MASPLHSRLAPSAASRWTVCTASVGYIEANAALLPKEGGIYADEGTEAHEWARKLLTKEARIMSAPAEMMQHVREYVDFVQGYFRPGDRMYVEKRLPLFYFPEQRGTLDVAIVGKDRTVIIDLKYGAGVPVQAVENKQLASYAESLIRELEVIENFRDDHIVILVIYQPRDRNDPNPERRWPITRGALREFTNKIDEKAKLILSGGPTEFHADPETTCRFCPAKGICKAYASYGLDALPTPASEAVVDPSKLNRMEVLLDPRTLTREQRVRVIAARKGLEKWLEAVEDQEVHELMSGADPIGYKLVEGKSNRQWSDEKEADTLLSNHLKAEDRRPPGDLISPAAAEKALKGVELSTRFKNRMSELIVKPAGKPTLVPESDKRAALQLKPSEGMERILTAEDVI